MLVGARADGEPTAGPLMSEVPPPSSDIGAKRLTGGMIVKEFLAQCLAPLQAHSRPLWEYRVGDEGLRLRSRDLPTEDLSRATTILVGGDPGDLPEALGLLYCHDVRANLVATMHVFNELVLLPAEGSGPVEVSSGDTSNEGDSKRTADDRPTCVPLPSQSILLRDLEDDDATGVPPAGISSRPARPSRGPRRLRAAHGLRTYVVSSGTKRKKTVVKPKATPDAPPDLIGASSPVGGDVEARGAPSLALVVEPPEPPKHREATMEMPLPGGQACEGPHAPEVSMLAIVEQSSAPLFFMALPLWWHHPHLR
ncbi:hypothetical protein D1007_30479 [Hordeum vulgare]|nr:hypothetical protein D1007_30479 [Hordeum vulgare]